MNCRNSFRRSIRYLIRFALPFHETREGLDWQKLLAFQAAGRARQGDLLVNHFVIEANPAGILAGDTEVKVFKSGPLNCPASHWAWLATGNNLAVIMP